MVNTLVPQDNRPPKMYDDKTGIQVVRGSQNYGDPILTSVQKAYSNLIYHPIGLVFLVLGTLVLLAEYNNTHGPLEFLRDVFQKIVDDPTEPKFIVNIARVMLGILAWTVLFKIRLAELLLVWFPYIAKPSSRTMTFAILLTVAVIFIKKFTPFEVFIVAQLFYLFVMFRDPSHKITVIVLFVAVFVLGIVNIEKMIANTSDAQRRQPHVHHQVPVTKPPESRRA